MSEDLNFADLTPIELPVTVGGVGYVLREADEGVAARYREAGIQGARFDDGKIHRVQGLGHLQGFLLSMCLYRAVDGKIPLNKTGDPDPASLVPESMINRWPSRVVRPLYDKCKEISRLDENETPEELQKQIVKLQERLAKITPANPKN